MINHLITAIFFLISFVGLSQQDSLIITTEIGVDSIYIDNQKLDFLSVNDSIFKLEMERDVNATESRLIIYSDQKTYEVNLPDDPAAEFPAEWTTRDPKNPVSVYISVKNGECVTMRAGGSAVNKLSYLAVSDAKGELIMEDSCGVYAMKKRRSKRK